MRFRPCIDLHRGKVKQIVGSTLSDTATDSPVTNFETARPASYYADMYRRDGLTGGHVIMLGPGNEKAAESALSAYSGGLQLGGGMRPDNARRWLDRGAAKIIVTSYVFVDGAFRPDRLSEMVRAVGKDRLVLDVSCSRIGKEYVVAADRWQTFTDLTLRPETLADLARYCSEFLVHAVESEGKQQGIERRLIARLGEWSPIPTTYAGGIRSMTDILAVEELGGAVLDFTVGSALDIFGGSGLRYNDVVTLDRARRSTA